ncbi:MAG: queuosine precursor transporter [Bacteroidetes bacterium]|nr:queuosine precursor transporter [Bacteroidota bacterium]
MDFSNNAVQNRKNTLYVVLSCLFITNAIIAEFGGVKIFSAEQMLGLKPAHLHLFGSVLDFNMSVGVLIWPFVFILSDIMNEFFGKSGVRRISYITAIMIAYGFMVILAWTKMPAAEFWLQLNGQDSQGRPFDVNFAYSTIFRQGLGIIIGSLTAFLVSQFVDVYSFHYFRKITGHRYLWLRATGSTVISQLIDSFLILIIAFYFFGNWSIGQVLKVGLVQYCYKVLLAIGLTPLVYLAHFIIDRYLGKEVSVQMVEETNENW